MWFAHFLRVENTEFWVLAFCASLIPLPFLAGDCKQRAKHARLAFWVISHARLQRRSAG